MRTLYPSVKEMPSDYISWLKRKVDREAENMFPAKKWETMKVEIPDHQKPNRGKVEVGWRVFMRSLMRP